MSTPSSIRCAEHLGNIYILINAEANWLPEWYLKFIVVYLWERSDLKATPRLNSLCQIKNKNIII
jgi:hypothetical protein